MLKLLLIGSLWGPVDSAVASDCLRPDPLSALKEFSSGIRFGVTADTSASPCTVVGTARFAQGDTIRTRIVRADGLELESGVLVTTQGGTQSVVVRGELIPSGSIELDLFYVSYESPKGRASKPIVVGSRYLDWGLGARIARTIEQLYESKSLAAVGGYLSDDFLGSIEGSDPQTWGKSQELSIYQTIFSGLPPGDLQGIVIATQITPYPERACTVVLQIQDIVLIPRNGSMGGPIRFGPSSVAWDLLTEQMLWRKYGSRTSVEIGHR